MCVCLTVTNISTCSRTDDRPTCWSVLRVGNFMSTLFISRDRTKSAFLGEAILCGAVKSIQVVSSFLLNHNKVAFGITEKRLFY